MQKEDLHKSYKRTPSFKTSQKKGQAPRLKQLGGAYSGVAPGQARAARTARLGWSGGNPPGTHRGGAWRAQCLDFIIVGVPFYMSKGT